MMTGFNSDNHNHSRTSITSITCSRYRYGNYAGQKPQVSDTGRPKLNSKVRNCQLSSHILRYKMPSVQCSATGSCVPVHDLLKLLKNSETPTARHRELRTSIWCSLRMLDAYSRKSLLPQRQASIHVWWPCAALAMLFTRSMYANFHFGDNCQFHRCGDLYTCAPNDISIIACGPHAPGRPPFRF